METAQIQYLLIESSSRALYLMIGWRVVVMSERTRSRTHKNNNRQHFYFQFGIFLIKHTAGERHRSRICAESERKKKKKANEEKQATFTKMMIFLVIEFLLLLMRCLGIVERKCNQFPTETHKRTSIAFGNYCMSTSTTKHAEDDRQTWAQNCSPDEHECLHI